MVFLDILLPIFVLVGAGAVFSRTLRPALEPLSQFALFLAAPALVFHALLSNPVSAAEVGRLLALMGLYTGLFWVIAEGVARCLGLTGGMRRAFALATVPMNVGNYGLPLVRFAFGAEAEPFSVLVFVIFNIPLTTWAIWLAAGGTFSSLRGLGATLRIPIFHATILAFALGALGWNVPSPIAKGVGLLAQGAIPVLLVILGMQLERTRIESFGPSLLAAVGLRLLLSPVLAWGLSTLLGFDGLERSVLVLQTSTPSAVLVLLYALRFECHPRWLASCIFVSTLGSALSLSAVLSFLL
ncbi:MAG: AEC family transporter [Deferrisomatales bacterium]|nr:AEC family transporter [Deferrisomatales bacterium]